MGRDIEIQSIQLQMMIAGWCQCRLIPRVHGTVRSEEVLMTQDQWIVTTHRFMSSERGIINSSLQQIIHPCA